MPTPIAIPAPVAGTHHADTSVGELVARWDCRDKPDDEAKIRKSGEICIDRAGSESEQRKPRWPSGRTRAETGPCAVGEPRMGDLGDLR